MKSSLVLVLALVVLTAGCRSTSSPGSYDSHETRDGRELEEAESAAPVTAGSVDASPGVLPPLAAEWMERIDLPGGQVVNVAPPVGSTERRPVIVAVHGAVDDPALMCSAWRLVADVYPFVVCPGGAPLGGSKYVWRSSDAIDRSIDAALAAVRARWGERVHQGPAVYVAFSQGANMAGPVLGRRPGRFARAVLTEGGYGAFAELASAKAYAAAGGERVLFTCSQSGCAGAFERSHRSLTRAGVDVRVSYSGPHGHSIPPPVRASLNDALPWVIEGLAGWETYAAAPKLSTH